MSNPQIVSNILLTMFSWGVRCDSRAELEDMLPALRVLHPHGPTGDICEARLEIGSSNWLGASQVLRQIDERGDGGPISWALQSWCLYMLGDIEWQRCARAVLANGHPTAIAIVDRFLAAASDDQPAGYRSTDASARVMEALSSNRVQAA
ncbi:HrpB1 family type III secretion system apparatus protein [Burkholderia arboris]|uniref:HrpB1 family type III secretion system apparatus protein n=1 Tax=Burkholderia arboris TaxID=488730 RepID=UPI001589B5F5|nr:HrpB1 family type III secretion system apparatus protein [Burkholderia arboris]MBY8606286.1 HrpB1 family type III secretion system apparatus protein [Burkholderia arboris]MCA8047076.1 HrpB1 family type III secretion system apparatus protein [Burkholderia arboris]